MADGKKDVPCEGEASLNPLCHIGKASCEAGAAAKY